MQRQRMKWSRAVVKKGRKWRICIDVKERRLRNDTGMSKKMQMRYRKV
jgi:hypothetical protein